MNKEKTKLVYLQVLRGIAALLVCFFHFRNFFKFPENWGQTLFGNGRIGVPMFFIISGFIMAYTTKHLSGNKLADVKTFLLKRIIRILPLYVILTIGFVILQYEVGYHIKSNFWDVIQAFLFIPNNSYPPLYVGWTLNYEMFFYLIFGLCLIFGNKRHYAFLVSIIILLIVIPLATKGFVNFNQHKGYNYISPIMSLITSHLIWQFGLGVAFAYLLPKLTINFTARCILLVLSVILFSFHYFIYFDFYQSDLVFCGLLVGSIVLFDFSGINLKAPGFLVFLGNISYSLYLVHPLFLISLPFYFLRNEWIESETMVFFVMIPIYIVAAAISYELIEKRLTNMIKRIVF